MYACNREADNDKSILENFYEETRRDVEMLGLTAEVAGTAQEKLSEKFLFEKGCKVAAPKVVVIFHIIVSLVRSTPSLTYNF